jgi:hypothetical protein
MSRSEGFGFTTSWDTALPPLAPMMLMIPRRGQGMAGEVSGLIRQLVEDSLQFGKLLSLRPGLF